MPLTLSAHLAAFRKRWLKPAPITPTQAAKVLSQAARDVKTAYERTHDRLRAERDAGWPQVSR